MQEKPTTRPTPQPATRAEPVTGPSLPLRVAALSSRRPNRFHLRPDAGARAAIAADLGLIALRKLDFIGAIEAEGRGDWRLQGQLGATVVQPCVITAEPVSTRIEIPASRLFRAEAEGGSALAGGETEMPEDDSIEPLGTEVDPGAVMIEALALALPDYPRKPGAELGEAGALDLPPPAATAPDSPRENPFAVLARLRGGTGDGRDEA